MASCWRTLVDDGVGIKGEFDSMEGFDDRKDSTPCTLAIQGLESVMKIRNWKGRTQTNLISDD